MAKSFFQPQLYPQSGSRICKNRILALLAVLFTLVSAAPPARAAFFGKQAHATDGRNTLSWLPGNGKDKPDPKKYPAYYAEKRAHVRGVLGFIFSLVGTAATAATIVAFLIPTSYLAFMLTGIGCSIAGMTLGATSHHDRLGDGAFWVGMANILVLEVADAIYEAAIGHPQSLIALFQSLSFVH